MQEDLEPHLVVVAAEQLRRKEQDLFGEVGVGILDLE